MERWTESGLIGTLKIAQRFSGERLVRRALGSQGYEVDDLTEGPAICNSKRSTGLPTPSSSEAR